MWRILFITYLFVSLTIRSMTSPRENNENVSKAVIFPDKSICSPDFPVKFEITLFNFFNYFSHMFYLIFRLLVILIFYLNLNSIYMCLNFNFVFLYSAKFRSIFLIFSCTSSTSYSSEEKFQFGSFAESSKLKSCYSFSAVPRFSANILSQII